MMKNLDILWYMVYKLLGFDRELLNFNQIVRYFRIMKRILGLILTALLIFALASCSTGGGIKSNLTGPPQDILDKVIEEAGKTMTIPQPLPPLPGDDGNGSSVTAENSQYAIGLSSDDFTKYVTDVAVSQAAILTSAHEVILIQAKDARSAAEVKRLVADGYDSGKWVCVFPEKCCVIDSGDYVLLVSSTAVIVDAVIDAFKTVAGSTGEANTFFTSDAGAGGGGLQIG